MQVYFNSLFTEGPDFIKQIKYTPVIGWIRNIMTNNMQSSILHLMINRFLFHLFKNVYNYFAFVFPIQFFTNPAGIQFPPVQHFRLGKNLQNLPCNMFGLMLINKIAHLV